MSTSAEEWDLVVPEDGAELLAEFRRHGLKPGQRWHLSAVPDPTDPRRESSFGPAGSPVHPDPVWRDFLGTGGESDPDLSANAKRIVRDEMGE